MTNAFILPMSDNHPILLEFVYLVRLGSVLPGASAFNNNPSDMRDLPINLIWPLLAVQKGLSRSHR